MHHYTFFGYNMENHLCGITRPKRTSWNHNDTQQKKKKEKKKENDGMKTPDVFLCKSLKNHLGQTFIKRGRARARALQWKIIPLQY